MLKKCLKYDLKYGLFIWSILSSAMILLAAPSGLSIKCLNAENAGAINAAAGLCVFVYYILAIAYFIGGFGIGVYRFYQNFRTDEAYLTFTLPVKRKTLLHSKLLATIITFLATAVIIFISLIIVCALIPKNNTTYLALQYTRLCDWFKESYKARGFWTVVYIAQAVILAFEALCTIVLLCFSIANRTNSNKNKAKSSIGKNIALAFLVYVVMGLLSIPLILLVLAIVSFSEAISLTGTVTFAESNVISFLTLIMFTMATVILNVILYKDNLNRIRSKLNLA